MKNKLGLVDRFHIPVPKPVFIKPVPFSKPAYWNRFETETGFNKKTVLGLVFLEKLLIQP